MDGKRQREGSKQQAFQKQMAPWLSPHPPLALCPSFQGLSPWKPRNASKSPLTASAPIS